MPKLRDRSIESRALVAAQDRLIRSGLTREQAARRLLPQQSPESASRYLRKLRTGERTGRQIATREPIRRRLAILAPSVAAPILRTGRTAVMVNVDTTIGPRSVVALIDQRWITPHGFMTSPGYEAWRESVERRWRLMMGYSATIEQVTKIRPLSRHRAPAVVLESAA